MSNRLRSALLPALLVFAVAPRRGRCSGIRERSRGRSHADDLRRAGDHRRPCHHAPRRRGPSSATAPMAAPAHARAGCHRRARRRRPCQRIQLGRHLEREFSDFLVSHVAGETADRHAILVLLVNQLPLGGRMPAAGQPATEVLWAFDSFGEDPACPWSSGPGRGATVAREHAGRGRNTGAPQAGATVGGTPTGSDGVATLTLPTRASTASRPSGRGGPVEHGRTVRGPARRGPLHFERQVRRPSSTWLFRAKGWPASAGARARCLCRGRPTTRPAQACRTTRPRSARSRAT